MTQTSPRWEDLGGGAGLWVTKEAPLTTDALLLAHFAQPKKDWRCADLGTGCGVIPILWRQRGHRGPTLAVEIQEDLAHMAARSVAENGFTEITVLQGDAGQPKGLLPGDTLDLIACNPPYYPQGAGETGEGPRSVARHEDTLTLHTLAQTARYALKWGGRLCTCLPAERLAQAMAVFSGAGLEPKQLQLVQSTPERAPYLALLACRRGGKPGLAVLQNLTINDETGRPTEAMLAVYGSYRKGDPV